VLTWLLCAMLKLFEITGFRDTSFEVDWTLVTSNYSKLVISLLVAHDVASNLKLVASSCAIYVAPISRGYIPFHRMQVVISVFLLC